MPLEKRELTIPVPSTPSPPIEVVSSDGTQTYSVDIAALSCTCPDFQKRRSSLPERSIGRCCKHLSAAIVNDPSVFRKLGAVERCILEIGRAKPEYQVGQTAAGGELVVGTDLDSPWLDVFFRKHKKGDLLGRPTGEWAMYGLHLATWEWSYGDGPRGAREIKEILKPLRENRMLATHAPAANAPVSEQKAGCARAAVCLAVVAIYGLRLLL